MSFSSIPEHLQNSFCQKINSIYETDLREVIASDYAVGQMLATSESDEVDDDDEWANVLVEGGSTGRPDVVTLTINIQGVFPEDGQAQQAMREMQENVQATHALSGGSGAGGAGGGFTRLRTSTLMATLMRLTELDRILSASPVPRPESPPPGMSSECDDEGGEQHRENMGTMGAVHPYHLEARDFPHTEAEFDDEDFARLRRGASQVVVEAMGSSTATTTTTTTNTHASKEASRDDHSSSVHGDALSMPWECSPAVNLIVYAYFKSPVFSTTTYAGGGGVQETARWRSLGPWTTAARGRGEGEGECDGDGNGQNVSRGGGRVATGATGSRFDLDWEQLSSSRMDVGWRVEEMELVLDEDRIASSVGSGSRSGGPSQWASRSSRRSVYFMRKEQVRFVNAYCCSASVQVPLAADHNDFAFVFPCGADEAFVEVSE
jgi:hypothetical protein